MGIKLFGNSSSSDCKCRHCTAWGVKKSAKLPNPDPRNWVVDAARHIGAYLVVQMIYPDCTNYEGKKVMVFKCTMEDLKEQAVIDPHFGEDQMHYPIARFEPTVQGWRDACNFATMKHLDLQHDQELQRGKKR